MLSENLNLPTPRDLALRRLTPQRKGALRPQNRSRSRSRYLSTWKQEQRSETPFLWENCKRSANPWRGFTGRIRLNHTQGNAASGPSSSGTKFD
jgi:hypothetical protein